MANDLNQSSYVEDDIDFLEIIKIFIEYKKLIISTILIFTISSIIYSVSLKPSFVTSVKLETGYLTMSNGNIVLIESSSDLISGLKILLTKNPDDKFGQNISMNSFEEKIISLETISSSAEQNENLLTEIINYIDERHSNLEKLFNRQEIVKLSNEVENTKAEITHFKSKLSDQYLSPFFDIILNLKKEDQAGETLELLNRNSVYEDKLFDLKQSLELSIQKLNMFNKRVYTKTQIIQKIKTKTTKSKKESLIIPLGIIFGVITSIFLVLINNFIKSYRETKA